MRYVMEVQTMKERWAEEGVIVVPLRTDTGWWWRLRGAVILAWCALTCSPIRLYGFRPPKEGAER